MCVGTPSAGLAWGPCVRVDLDVVWSTRAMASKACVFVPLVGGITGLLGPLAWILVPAGWCPLINSIGGWGHGHGGVAVDGARLHPNG